MPQILIADEMSKCIGCFSCMLICAAMNQHNHSIQKSRIKIRTYGGMQGTFVATVCCGCADPACAEACIAGALTARDGGGVVHHAHRCIGCMRCVDACPIGAVFFDSDKNTPLICRHCGGCVSFCPHNCLVMREL